MKVLGTQYLIGAVLGKIFKSEKEDTDSTTATDNDVEEEDDFDMDF